MTLTSTTCYHKTNRSHALRGALLAFTLILSSAISFAIEAEEVFILPSFDVDLTQGASDSGFIVHATNTTTDIDPNCTDPIDYTWSVSDGVEGIDWDFVEGTSASDEDVAIEFITQGCYDIHMSAEECLTGNSAAPETITVAGKPNVTSPDADLSSCTNINVETQWLLASNNNASVDFDISLDGISIFSDTSTGALTCNTIDAIDFSNVISIGLLSEGMHQLVFTATGDINNNTDPLIFDFEIFPIPSISLSILPVCEDAAVECIVTAPDTNTIVVFSPVPDSINVFTAIYDSLTINNGALITVFGEIDNGVTTCLNSTTETVVLQDNPEVNVTVTPPSACVGQSSIVQGTGADSFTWESTALPCDINASLGQAEFCNLDSTFSGTMTGDLTYPSTGVTCSTTVPFDINVAQLPELTIINSPVSGCEGDNVSYEVSSETTSGTAEYLWSVNGDPQAGSDSSLFTTSLSGASPFQVSVEVTEPSGCTASLDLSTVIFANPILTVVPSDPSNYPICSGINLPICASGADTYEWEGDPSLTAGCENIPFGFFTTDSLITVTGTTTVGSTTCSSSIDFIVEYEDQPIIEVTSSGAVCAGDDLTVTATGGASYTWITTPSSDIDNGDSITFNNIDDALISGNVIGSTANGCETTTSFSYIVNQSPIASLSIMDADNVYCSTDSAILGATLTLTNPPYTIEWSLDGALIHTETATGANSDYTFDLTGLTSTSIIDINVTDNNGCATQDDQSIEVYEGVDFSLAATAACEGTPVFFTASGNAESYAWPTSLFTGGTTNTNSAIMPDGTDVDVDGTITHPMTAIGVLICSATESATSVVELNPVVSIDPLTGSSFCADQEPIVIASGADSYVWSPAPMSQNLGTATYDAFLSSPFLGTVTGEIAYTDVTCSNGLNFSFDILDIPIVPLAVDSNIICGAEEALITTIGLDPVVYTFEWTLNGVDLGSSNDSISIPFEFTNNPGVNNISCVATDMDGCVGDSIIQVEVLEGAELELSTSPICDGDTLNIDVVTNGTVAWNISGAVENGTGFSFHPISNGEVYTATSTITVPSTLSGTDYDCTTESVSIVTDVRANPDLDFSFTGLACDGSDVTIDLSGGETYQWASLPSATTDSEVADPGNPDLNIQTLSYSDIAVGDLNISVVARIVYVDAGNLSCITFTDSIYEIFALPSISLSIPPVCEDALIECLVTAVDPTTTVVFSPVPDSVNVFTATYDAGTFNTGDVISVDGAIDYGTTTCTNTTSETVVLQVLPVIQVTPPAVVCYEGDITLSSTGGVSYDWVTTPTPDTVNNDSITLIELNIDSVSGNVTGFDSNGCSSTTPFNFIVNSLPVAILSDSTTGGVYCSTELATIEVNLNSGNSPYTIEWDLDGSSLNTETVPGPNSEVTFPLTDLSLTSTISVDVIDNMGCVTQEDMVIEVYEGVDFSLTSAPACEGDSVLFTASGNATNYEWPTPLFNGDTTATNSAVMPNGDIVDLIGTITYNTTAMGDLICYGSGSATAVVELNPVVLIDPTTGSSFCEDQEPVVIASGADSYVWLPVPDSEVGDTATYPTFSPTPLAGSVTGTIIYTGVSCSTELEFSFDILDLPVVPIAVESNIICGADEALVTTVGMDPLDYIFEWALNGVDLELSNDSISIPFVFTDNAGINNITCVATDMDGCVGDSIIQVEVLEGSQLELFTSPICDGDTLHIDVVTNGIVEWDVPVALANEDSTEFSFYPIVNGDVYTITSTFTVSSILNNGDYDCITDSSLVTDVRANPVIDLTFNGLACEGSDVTIDFSGGDSYVWQSIPNETTASEVADPGNPDLNIRTLSYLDIEVGNLNVDVVASILYDDAGPLTCSSDSVIEREINLAPSFSLDGLTAICTDSCMQFTIVWDTIPFLPITLDWTLDGVSHTDSNVFDYCPDFASGSSDVALFVVDGNSCIANSEVTVDISQHPIIDNLGDYINEGCSPLTVNFDAAVQLASQTAWNFGNGTTATGVADPQVIFDCDDYSSGECVFAISYTAISESNPTCITTGSDTITVHPLPISDFTLEEDAICFDPNGDAEILIENLSSDIFGLSCSDGVKPYAWTVFPTGVTDCTETRDEAPILLASGTGVFTIGLVVTDSIGCTTQVFNDFEVYELPIPDVTFLQSTICLPLQVELINTSIGATSFVLDVPGFVIPNNFESPYVLDVVFPGAYEAEFIVTSDDGCWVEIEIDTAFQAWHPPISDFVVTPEEITFLDPIVTFGNLSEGGTEYIWSFGDGEGSSEVSPEHEYERADSYEVQLLVTNEYGCTDASTQTISVNRELQIFVPNAFTPNNDGNNDAWIPHVNGEEFIISYECWVVDRWGKLVFNSTTIGEPWIGDNTSDGNGTHFVSSTESYSWRIEIKQADGKGAKIATGNVFLIR